MGQSETFRGADFEQSGTRDAQQRLLRRKEAALYLGVSVQTLAIWKSSKRYNLPVVKIGRLAKYRVADLEAFIASRTIAG